MRADSAAGTALNAAAALGPVTAASAVTWRLGGRAAVRTLLRRAVSAPGRWGWYALALAIPLATSLRRASQSGESIR